MRKRFIKTTDINTVEVQYIEESIVTRPKGSWRWQDAFGVSEHTLTFDGPRPHWQHALTYGKFSMPQLKRGGIDSAIRRRGRILKSETAPNPYDMD